MAARRPLAPSWSRKPTTSPRQTLGAWGKTSTPNYTPPPGGATAPVTAGYAPPAAPAAPAGGTAAPVDAQYLADLETLKRRRDTDLPTISGQRQRELSDYGFNESALDEATGKSTLTFDPNNPFSKAALLKQSWDRSRRGSAQSMGSSGGLYSGAFQNQQDYVNRGQLGAEDTLQKSLGAFLAANTGQRTQALSDFELGGIQAEANRVGRIPSNPLYEPTASDDEVAPAVTAAAAGNKTGAIVTNKLGHKGRWVTRPDGTRYFQRV